MKNFLRQAAAATLAVFIGVTFGQGAFPSAQSRAEDSEPPMRQLIAEVRGLRAAIERYADRDVRTRAMTDVLSIQQRRTAEAAARADAVRKQLDSAITEMRHTASDIDSIETGTRGEDSFHADTLAGRQRERREVLGALKENLRKLSEDVEQLRLRENELLNVLVAEEAAWQNLVSQMNDFIKK